MNALTAVRDQHDDVAHEVWKMQGQIDEVTTDVQRGLDRAVKRLDHDIEAARLKELKKHKDKFKLFKIQDMYKLDKDKCYACDHNLTCHLHRLGKRYDPLQGTIAMNGAPIKKDKQAKLSNVRIQ